MAEIAPFRGILYTTQAGAPDKLLAPPYDVISTRSATSWRRSTRTTACASSCRRRRRREVRQRRARSCSEWLDDGILARDDRAGALPLPPDLHRRGQRPATRKGFICRIRLHRFDEGVVLPHERTLAGPKADRLKLKRATRAHLSQVFGLYSDPERESDAPFEAVEQDGAGARGHHHRRRRRSSCGGSPIRRRSAEVVAAAGRQEGLHRRRPPSLRDHARAARRAARGGDAIGRARRSSTARSSWPTWTTRACWCSPRTAWCTACRRFDARRCSSARARVLHRRATRPPATPRRCARALGGAGPERADLRAGAPAIGDRLPDAAPRRRPRARAVAAAGPTVLRTLDVTLLHALVIEQHPRHRSRARRRSRPTCATSRTRGQALDEARRPACRRCS